MSRNVRYSSTSLALITLLAGQTFHARNVVVSVFVMVWAARLAGTSHVSES